jgi:hypothetical protein
MHARAVESLSHDRGDELAALHAVVLQARVELTHHREKTAIELLEPALARVAQSEVSSQVVEAQIELGRALMIGGSNSQSLAWIDRALTAPEITTDQLLTDAIITKGTALINSGRSLEGETLLRGARQIAERNGDIWASVRALNNMMTVVTNQDLAVGSDLLAEGYALAHRYGLTTWAYQFAHSSLSQAFERGDWESWLEETKSLDAPGFYGAWRLLEEAMRDAWHGRIDEARQKVAAGTDFAGTESRQAAAGIAATSSLVALAAGDLEGVARLAEGAWGDPEGTGFAAAGVALAAAAANRLDWAMRAKSEYEALGYRGRVVDGLSASLATTIAMLEQRWSDARSAYLQAHADLTGSGALFNAAILDLAVGSRAAGQFAESAEAANASREFFLSRGAGEFLERYGAAFVPAETIPVEARPAKPTDAGSVVEA